MATQALTDLVAGDTLRLTVAVASTAVQSSSFCGMALGGSATRYVSQLSGPARTGSFNSVASQ